MKRISYQEQASSWILTPNIRLVGAVVDGVVATPAPDVSPVDRTMEMVPVINGASDIVIVASFVIVTGHVTSVVVTSIHGALVQDP
jgi:hypothetical protein